MYKVVRCKQVLNLLGVFFIIAAEGSGIALVALGESCKHSRQSYISLFVAVSIVSHGVASCAQFVDENLCVIVESQNPGRVGNFWIESDVVVGFQICLNLALHRVHQ